MSEKTELSEAEQQAIRQGIAEVFLIIKGDNGKKFPLRVRTVLDPDDEWLDGKTFPPSVRARRDFFVLSRCKNPFSPHHRAAYMVLKDQDKSVEIQDKLARALVEVLPELADCVDPKLDYDSPDASSEAEGDPPMLAWDARAADYLEGLGDMGAEYASAFRKKAAERWQAYLETGDEELLWSWWIGFTNGGETYRFMATLATVLWHDRVQPNLHKIQSLTRPVVKVIADVSSKKAIVETTNNGFEVICEGRKAIARFSEALGEVPVADYQATLRLAQAGATKLRSLTCARFLIWLTARICDQWAAGLEPGKIHIDGAWTGLAREVGLASKKAPTDLRQICAALRCLDFQAPDGSTGALLTYREKQALGQAPGWLKITALEPLCPVYANRRKGDNLLVPILALPPLFGSPQIHGQLANLWLRFELELVNGSIELSRTGGIKLPPGRWVELGSQAGLPEGRAMEARDRWSDGDEPAILMIAPDRFTLGDMHVEAKNHLIRQGLARAKARQAGRAGSKGRWGGANRRRKK